MSGNLDEKVVRDFGREWSTFDQSEVPVEELRAVFEEYFSEFPWATLDAQARGFDLGCGSGRWAWFVAPRVGELHCVDASAAALKVARAKLAEYSNCQFHLASVVDIPLPDGSMDFGYSLGVLHHVPDTAAGIRSCVRKLRPGAPFLVYLYYRFDDRSWWFRALWRLSDLLRRAVSVLPHGPKLLSTQVIAALVYWPFARAARLVELTGLSVGGMPLAYYRDKSFYTMRTDALDRFGTRLEQRFTRSEIAVMLRDAGLVDVRFRAGAPYWCATGRRDGPGVVAGGVDEG